MAQFLEQIILIVICRKLWAKNNNNNNCVFFHFRTKPDFRIMTFPTKENGVVPTQPSCSGKTRKGLLNNWQEQEISKGGKNEPGEGLKKVLIPDSEISPDLNCSVSMKHTKNTPKQELHHHPPPKETCYKKNPIFLAACFG